MTRGKLLLLLLAHLLLGLLAFWPVHFRTDGEFWSRVLDAGHLPWFAGMALVYHFTLPVPRAGEGRRRLHAAGLTIVVAALVELCQPLTGRAQDWRDLMNGALGALLAVSGLCVWHAGRDKTWRVLHALAALVLVGWCAMPALADGAGLWWRHTRFPLLGDFETEAELRLWTAVGASEHAVTQISRTRERATRGSHALQVRTSEDAWAGTAYAAGDQDWSGFHRLAGEIYNPGRPFTLWLRVDDDGDCRRFGSRFDRGFALRQGWNRLSVTLTELEHGPQHRPLNTRAIRRLVLFTGREPQPRRFLVDNVRLE